MYLAYKLVNFVAFMEICVNTAVEGCIADGVITVSDLFGYLFEGHAGVRLTHSNTVLLNQAAKLFQTL